MATAGVLMGVWNVRILHCVYPDGTFAGQVERSAGPVVACCQWTSGTQNPARLFAFKLVVSVSKTSNVMNKPKSKYRIDQIIWFIWTLMGLSVAAYGTWYLIFRAVWP